MGMNVVVLTGNLTRDPELKYTQSGKAFARFSLAVSNSYNREKVDFINCTAWGKTAEIIAEYLRKGSKAGVHGRIQTGSYEKDGHKVYTTDIVVENIEFLDSKQTKNGSQVVEERSFSSNNNESGNNNSNVDDEEFPF